MFGKKKLWWTFKNMMLVITLTFEGKCSKEEIKSNSQEEESYMIDILCSPLLGFPGQFWQWHPPKKRHRPSHLCTVHKNPSLVLVWEDYSEVGAAGMHRGRVRTPHILQPSSLFFFSLSLWNELCKICRKLNGVFFMKKCSNYGRPLTVS